MQWQGDGFVHLLASGAKSHPDRIYASEFTRDGLIQHRFVEIAERSARLAAGLAAKGISKGDRVALMLDTHSDYLCMVLGLAQLGAIWVPVGTKLMPANLEYIFREASVQMIIAEAALANVLDETELGLATVILRNPETGLAAEIDAEPLPVAEVAPSDLLMISFTSGTTGKPKSVPVTHAMMRFASQAATLAAKAGKGDVLYVWEPFHHIGGAQLIILPLFNEASLALTSRFSASRFWDQCRQAGATRIHHLGGILQMLLKQPAKPDDRDHPVKLAWGGGCTADVWAAFAERFGVEITECYGMTECSSLTTLNDENMPGYIGRPMPWFQVDILRPDGSVCETDEKGEIVVTPIGKGKAALFAGYMNSAEATAEALRDGRMFTGDQGSKDAEGRIRFFGRLKDTIRVRGENVSSWEVEHIAEKHEQVAAAAVIGVTAEIGEADIKLFVQPLKGVEIDVAALAAWIDSKLAPHQQPRHIAVVEEFPRTPSMRIMKHLLDKTPAGNWTRPERMKK